MLNIDSMVKNLRTVSGQTDNELTDIEALAYLNKAYWKILDEFDFRQKERTTFFNTVAGVEAYQLPVLFEAVQYLAIVDANGVRTPLIPLSRPKFDTNYTSDENYRTLPTGYIRERDSIRLQPIPDTVYTIYLNYWTTLADLADTNNSPELPQAWHEIIELGAKYRLLMDIGDHQAATLFYQVYGREIATLKPTKAKELVDQTFAGVEVLGRNYDQRDPRL